MSIEYFFDILYTSDKSRVLIYDLYSGSKLLKKFARNLFLLIGAFWIILIEVAVSFTSSEKSSLFKLAFIPIPTTK